MVYSPVSLVFTVVVVPLPVSVTLTVALGIEAPVWSWMVPMMLPVVTWAAAVNAAKNKPAKRATLVRTAFEKTKGLMPFLVRCPSGQERGYAPFDREEVWLGEAQCL